MSYPICLNSSGILHHSRFLMLLLSHLFCHWDSIQAQGRAEQQWREYDGIANSLNRDEIDKALLYADSALQIANQSNLSEERNHSYLTLATLTSVKDQYDTSFYFVRNALKGFVASENAIGCARSFNRLGINYQFQGNYERALQVLDSSLSILEMGGLRDSAANTFENISNTYIYLAQYEKSLHFANKALELRNMQADSDTVQSFMNLGIIYSYKGDYPKSLDYYKRALRAREAQGDSFMINQVKSNIGILYREMRLYEKAEHHFTAALNYFNHADFKKLAGRTHNNLGNLYQATGETEKARFHLEKALEIEKLLGSEQDLWIPNLNLGYFYEGNQEFEKAKAHFQKALALSEESGNHYGSVLCNINIAACHSQLGDNRKAVKMIHGADSIIRTIDDLSFQQYAFYKCYTIYENAGRLGDAIEFFKEYVTIKDSLMNTQKISQIAEIESKHEILSKEREVVLTNERAIRLEVTNELMSTQRKALILLVIGLLAVLALIIGVYRLKMKQQQSEYKELEREAAQAAKDIANKNRLLKELRDRVSNQEISKPTSSNSEFLNLFKLIESSSSDETDWVHFQEKFSKLHPAFLQRLEQAFPNLTDNDLRLAALIRLRMTSKEIAGAINVEHVSVQKARYRLKKKLALDLEQDLARFICNY